MEPSTIVALVTAIISSIGIAILSIVKIIKRSTCCYGCFDCESKDETEKLVV